MVRSSCVDGKYQIDVVKAQDDTSWEPIYTTSQKRKILQFHLDENNDEIRDETDDVLV